MNSVTHLWCSIGGVEFYEFEDLCKLLLFAIALELFSRPDHACPCVEAYTGINRWHAKNCKTLLQLRYLFNPMGPVYFACNIFLFQIKEHSNRHRATFTIRLTLSNSMAYRDVQSIPFSLHSKCRSLHQSHHHWRDLVRKSWLHSCTNIQAQLQAPHASTIMRQRTFPWSNVCGIAHRWWVLRRMFATCCP